MPAVGSQVDIAADLAVNGCWWWKRSFAPCICA